MQSGLSRLSQGGVLCINLIACAVASVLVVIDAVNEFTGSAHRALRHVLFPLLIARYTSTDTACDMQVAAAVTTCRCACCAVHHFRGCGALGVP